MTDRVKRLKSKIITKGQPICIEKYRITLASDAETRGEPPVLRRAKTLAATLDKMPIIILPDELIVGNPASKPWGLEIDATVGLWDKDEVQGLREAGFIVDEKDEEDMLEMNKVFKPFGQYEGANLVVGPTKRLDEFLQTGMVLPPWKPNTVKGNRVGGGSVVSGLGLAPGWMMVCIDYGGVMQRGLRAMLEECENEIQNNRYFYRNSYERGVTLVAMRTCLEALIRYANRNADEAERLAGIEADPVRKQELLDIAERCRHVPEYPCRDFRDAIQCFWFLFLMVVPSPSAPLGRFDQFMYPYYKADKESGKITDEEVVELLDCMRIRCMEVNFQSGKQNRKRSAGGARWNNMTIGGVKPDGSDATNELSYLVLDAVMDVMTPHHTVTIRVADSTPSSLLEKGVQCQAKGCSMPAFVSDRSYIAYFTQKSLGDDGLPIEIARDFCMTGCIDGAIPGYTRSVAVGFFIAPLALEVFMNNGVDKKTGFKLGPGAVDLDSYETYEDFLNAFKKEMADYATMAAESGNIKQSVFDMQSPYPMRSALMKDGIKIGLNTGSRKFDFESSNLLNLVGGVNLAQELYAIRKLVFQEKSYKLSELKAILDANWEGHEDLRQRCLSFPFYGNNNDEIDEIVADLYATWYDTVTKIPASYGGYTRATAISITSHEPGGALTGATLDGRFKGETLADACASPIGGKDTNGPLSTFASAMKINQDGFQAFLMNMKFHPSALQTPADYKKLADAIRVYLTGGGKMVQFNVVAPEVLLDAQAHPEDHKDLMVRVAGYSAYYVNLTPALQHEVYMRTAHQF